MKFFQMVMWRKKFCGAVLAGLLGVWPSHAAAQATVNPSRAVFTASSDHNSTLVQSYEIGLYILGASQPFQTVSIGKPTPDGTGTITIDMTAAFLGWPIVGTNYTADVAAAGPGGVARSTLSNTFSFTGGGACSFNVSPTSPSVPATSGSYTITVTATSGCAWTGVSQSPSWITVTGGSNGTGNGAVSYTAAANTSRESAGGRRIALGRRHHDRRLRLDRRQQQHQLDYRDGWQQRRRQRHGRIQRRCKHVDKLALRDADDCGTDRDDRPGRRSWSAFHADRH